MCVRVRVRVEVCARGFRKGDLMAFGLFRDCMRIYIHSAVREWGVHYEEGFNQFLRARSRDTMRSSDD